ncbi:hypothetical protein HK099_003849 [Clydaea vesicula]|uniref:Uncharacterized protein n=1 Tax=Clydaea vesicula TaxID=447962 RepID=A0AAD5U314_9FUNG|nr:hypothetical protein HK099_003849 [Clydaea vesicula]
MNPNKIPIQNRRSRIQKSSSPRGNSRNREAEVYRELRQKDEAQAERDQEVPEEIDLEVQEEVSGAEVQGEDIAEAQ